MSGFTGLPTATIKPLMHGIMAEFMDTPFPCVVYGINEDVLRLRAQPGGIGTAFGYVERGSVLLQVDGAVAGASAGQYFSLPVRDRMTVVAGPGDRAYMVMRCGYVGLGQVGGPAEKVGRLKYIDGCSDTLLIAPPLKGDPCFNLLHFPPGISQTKHTHPSVRAGLIHSGRGECFTNEGTFPLLPGSMFILAPDAVHAFYTKEEGMTLTVFHPDSDFGPTHEEHPMLNRTIVDGVSAKNIDAIRTKEIRE
jgi:quercetin dioxygenase-like cupin family protein